MTTTQCFLAVLTIVAFTSAFTTPSQPDSVPCKRRNRITCRSQLIRTGSDGDIDESRIHDDDEKRPCLIFPGGGLFFYWQAGVIAYLQEQGYDLSTTSSPCHLSGASAGALAATLAATEVNPYDATELALSLSEKAGVWDRPLGLQGVWGDMIYEWLDILLPDDAVERVGEKLHLIVTPVPSFGKSRICVFDSREDLIMANMASVHIPWFLDGNLTTNFRGKPHIDGSFLAKPDDYVSDAHSDQPKLILDFKRDPVMKKRSTEFVKLVSPQGIRDILEQGKKYAAIMDNEGVFCCLRRR